MSRTLRREQSSKGAEQQPSEGNARLDNLTLARKEGWRSFVKAPTRAQPEPLSTADLRRLGEDALADYNRQRRVWHANLGPIPVT